MKYKNLFTPLTVGNVTFRNRIFASATGHLDFDKDGILSDHGISYYERKAIGGAAAVAVGECYVDPIRGSRGSGGIMVNNWDSMHFLSRLADAVSRHGSVASTELQHSGIYGNSMPGIDLVPWGPSPREVSGRMVHEMSEEIILETIDAFARAALVSKNCGYGMVTVHGGHGWLIQQFYSKTTNQRTDRWGGSAENRARLAIAVCDAIHEKCGRNFPVEMRISGTEYEFGYGVDEAVEFAKLLEGHADIIHVSVGVHGDLSDPGWLKMSPTMFQEDGCNVIYAAEIKKYVHNTPICTVGSLTDPEMMEEIIGSGKADIVAIARGLLCDPDLPNKAREGREDEIRSCIRCFGCFSNLVTAGQIYCTMNPETSREREFSRALPPAEKKKVLVAGGGIAGMEAALSAEKFGHEVVLCEKEEALGGNIRCEENVPFKKHLHEYIELQKRRIAKSSIELRLNTEVTPELAKEIAPDVIIAALGAEQSVPPIPGITGGNVTNVIDAFRAPAVTGEKVVILGAGLAGCELAIYLHDLGKQVELVEMAASTQAENNMTQVFIVTNEMKNRGIKAHYLNKAVEVTAEGVRCETADGEAFYPADTIVLAAGMKARSAAASALAECADDFVLIGDCQSPKNIMHALKSAVTVARDSGRY